MQHETTLPGFADLHALAEAVGDLRYDALSDFLGALKEKLARDSAADLGRGRPKLATSLSDAATAVADAQRGIDEAWRLSRPKMGL